MINLFLLCKISAIYRKNITSRQENFFHIWIRICRRESPDSRHKPEGKEVFIKRNQKRGTGNSDSVPWVKINHEDRKSAKSRIYSGLTRMRSDRARRRSWRWFPVFYLSKLIPESSEFPVLIFWKVHPKTLRTSVFLSAVRKFPSQILIRQKKRGALMAKKAGDSGRQDQAGTSCPGSALFNRRLFR